jgi:hypothetical protein
MTDKELLELAAKAAGIEFGWIHDTPRIRAEMGWTPWNPLTDDGDALRLAVKLKMCVDIGGGGLVFAFCGEPECTEATEEIHPDPLAATRRAIVRAAAEIGGTK